MTTELLGYCKQFGIEPETIKRLDERIKEFIPESELVDGCKYARWAIVKEYMHPLELVMTAKHLKASKVFVGTVFGKEVNILMFVPFFE